MSNKLAHMFPVMEFRRHFEFRGFFGALFEIWLFMVLFS